MLIFGVVPDHGTWGAWLPVLLPLFFLLRASLARRRHRPPQPPQPAQRPTARQKRQNQEAELAKRWRAARAQHEQTAKEYAEFECDALAVLRLPDLVDTSIPATARFVEAFAESSALATDRQPPDDHAEKFIAAAEAAERAWRAARSAAERMRMGRFSTEEREALDRAIKLLTVAQESNHPAERRAAYDKARDQLTVLQRRTGWTLPSPAVSELERRVPRELA
jgi:hypothetical protein